MVPSSAGLRSACVPLMILTLLAGLLGGCARPRGASTDPSPPIDVVVSDTRPRQGQVVEFRLIGPDLSGGTLAHRGRDVSFRGTDPPRAWVGFDVTAGTGPRRIPIHLQRGRPGRPTRRAVRLRVRAGNFSVQHLTIPDTGKVVLDPESRRRVERERRRVARVMASGTKDRLWNDPFVPPLDPLPEGSGFGARRVLNGHPRAPHTGMDYPAPTGTPVRAVNRGRVRLADTLFFAGRAVYLDHGGGLFSLYYHLSEVLVEEGDVVPRGERIGRVGASGRVTGPHLHFAMRLHGARVDPSWFFHRDRPAAVPRRGGPAPSAARLSQVGP